MPIQDTDVNDIVNDKDFDNWLGGFVFSGPMALAPDVWSKAGTPARQYALDRILEALRRRSPPISYGDLQYPSELRLGVFYGAAEHLYQLAMSTAGGGDLYSKQRELWAEKFDDFIRGLTPTLSDGHRGASGGFGVYRR